MRGARSGHSARPPGVPRELVVRLYDLRYGQGLSYERISVLLNNEGVPLPAGGERWHRSSIERVLHTNYGQAIGRELGLINQAAARLASLET